MPVDSIARLVQLLSRLPGIGEKSATRLVLFIMRQEKAFALDLARALEDAVERIRLCVVCMTLTDAEVCTICADARRDRSTVCVVEDVSDLFAIERAREFRGVYHVLHGTIRPLDGVGPEHIRVRELLLRIEKKATAEIREIILATNPSVEGEATALYLQRLLVPLGLRVTRIASGLPMGGDLQYADSATIARALLGRREVG